MESCQILMNRYLKTLIIPESDFDLIFNLIKTSEIGKNIVNINDQRVAILCKYDRDAQNLKKEIESGVNKDFCK